MSSPCRVAPWVGKNKSPLLKKKSLIAKKKEDTEGRKKNCEEKEPKRTDTQGEKGGGASQRLDKIF